MKKVKLQYFKETGKYYSSGEYESKKEHAWDICAEVREMRAFGTLPGLREGAGMSFGILVEIDEVPHFLHADDLVKAIENLHNEIRIAAQLFRDYETQHLQKQPPDFRKAKRNGEAALRLEKLLPDYQPPAEEFEEDVK